MLKRIFSGIIVTILFIGMVSLKLNIKPVEASGTIYIRSDGSVDPPTVPISTVDNVTYTFTDDIYDSIVVERDNIVVDGTGYTLHGTGFGSGCGITFSGRSNVTIENMEIKEFIIGIEIWYSSNIILNGNNIIGFNVSGSVSEGIRLWHSSNCILTRNNVTANEHIGIRLWDSSNNILTDNNVTANTRHGVMLQYCSNNTLSGNVMSDNRYNFGVWSSVLSDFMHSIDVSNIVDGKPVYYLVDQDDLVINPATYLQVGYLALVNCANATVEDLTLTDNLQGLLLSYVINSRIINNNITNNDVGIWLTHSSSNIISGNNITASLAGQAGFGILLYYSSSNIISGNNIANNHIGIEFEYPWNNRFYHNNFMYNIWHQVRLAPAGYANVLDDGYPSGGNYWSDYTGDDTYSGPDQNLTASDGIGDTPYIIDINNQDRYPLISPWSPNIGEASKGGKKYQVQVISNATIVNFRVTPGALKFTVSGAANTSGYVRVIMPVGLNSTSIKVFLNHTRLVPPPYPSISTNETHYFIYFAFTFNSTYTISVQFPILGDITSEETGIPDGKVDIRDLFFASRRYGVDKTDPLWTDHGDINGDGKIDIEDITLVANHFGQSWPP